MKVVGFSGYSGSGKTTLLEQVIAGMRAKGLRVSVVKHAHHQFDIDHPGKDSWRHRQAGAFEVVVASSRRMAKIREYEHTHEPNVHELLAELSGCDWAFVEGFRRSSLPKIEVWRAAVGAPYHYADDACIMAVCTDVPNLLPVPPAQPVLNLNDANEVIDFLLNNASQHEYLPPDADAGRSPAETAERCSATATG